MATTHNDLRSKLVIKAARNIQRGYESEESVDGMFRPEIKLDLQRSRYMTESMKQTDGQATVLRQAKALAHVLDNMDIVIQDWERIVGLQTSDPNGLVHPIELNWKSVLRLVNSDMGKTLLDDEGRRELDALCDYWKGKSMSDRQQEMFGGDLAKYWKYEGTILWSHWTEGGIPDYESLFKTGIKGRIEQVESRLTEIDTTIPRDYIEQKEFLTAAVVALKGVLNFAARYARLAREKSEQEIDPERKATLAQIAETCQRVPENPPRTFLEAVQFFYFLHLIRYLEFSTIGIGVRLDILLGTFFENDLKAGIITREEALEILQLLWIKFMELGFVYSPLLTSVYGGVASLQALTIGGTDVDGNDITNDLTYLILETGKTMQSIEPSLVMRVHDGTPDKLFSEAVDVLRTGVGYPSLFNDQALVPLLQKWGPLWRMPGITPVAVVSIWNCPPKIWCDGRLDIWFYPKSCGGPFTGELIRKPVSNGGPKPRTRRPLKAGKTCLTLILSRSFFLHRNKRNWKTPVEISTPNTVPGFSSLRSWKVALKEERIAANGFIRL